jgi:hypothetical protein
MKKYFLMFLAMFLGLSTISAQAEDQKTLVIMDTAIDSSKFPNVIYEVCITTKSCTNGNEGIGTANVDAKFWNINGINHGHTVVSAALKANPSIKIIFIRITDVNKYPTFSAIHSNGAMLSKGLEWVINNSNKFNIGAVSISQVRDNFPKGTCPNDTSFASNTRSLKNMNIAVFSAVGNNAKWDHPSFPACIDGVYGVGATKPNGELAKYTHGGIGQDIVALGESDILDIKGSNVRIYGTSISTPVAAAILLGKHNGKNWDEIINSYSNLNNSKVIK